MKILLASAAGIVCFVVVTIAFDAALGRINQQALEDLSLVWSESTVGEPLPIRSWVVLALETTVVFFVTGITVGLLYVGRPLWLSLMTAGLVLIPTAWAFGVLLISSFNKMAWAPFLMRLALGSSCALTGAFLASAVIKRKRLVAGESDPISDERPLTPESYDPDDG